VEAWEGEEVGGCGVKINRTDPWEAEWHFFGLDASASDLEVAEAMAEWYIASSWEAGFKELNFWVHAKPGETLPVDGEVGRSWSGITTGDEEEGKEWVVKAMLAGKRVYFSRRRRGGGYTHGSIADWRREKVPSKPFGEVLARQKGDGR
jgi:hypothetical protein